VDRDLDVLVLKAQRNLPTPLVAACGRVPLGKCLCGRAAAAGQVQFADRIDERHDIGYEGMTPHGHYCVPMRLSGRTVGVLTLYVPTGFVRAARLEQCLVGVANALAAVVARKQAEETRK